MYGLYRFLWQLFFQDLFTDNIKMPKQIGSRHRHYWQMITVKEAFGDTEVLLHNKLKRLAN